MTRQASMCVLRFRGSSACRAFPATTDSRPGSDGKYRWRAICQFGELDAPGVGDTYQVRAVAFDRSTIAARLPARLPSSAPRQSGKSVIASAYLRGRHRLQPRHGRMTAGWKFPE